MQSKWMSKNTGINAQPLKTKRKATKLPNNKNK